MQTWIRQYAIGIYKFVSGNIIDIDMCNFVDTNKLFAYTKLIYGNIYYHQQVCLHQQFITVDNFVNIIK